MLQKNESERVDASSLIQLNKKFYLKEEISGLKIDLNHF